MKRFLKRNWLYIAAIAAGAALTPRAVEYAAEFRGFRGGIGGEYLVVPLFFLVAFLAKDVFETVREVLDGRGKRGVHGRNENI